jgi:hypothetical protein
MRDSGWLNLYSIGGYRVSLEGEDPELRQLANAVYAAARVDSGTADSSFRLYRSEPGRDSYCLSTAGVEICRQRNLADFFLDVEWTLTQQAMNGCQALIQVHAGAVAMHGAGLLVCGPPGSGKTSLVVGLTGHGATILTDEVGLLQADTGRPHSTEIDLIPFPRDLIVHRRTQQLFPRSAYDEEPCFKRFPDHCHLPPNRLDSASEPPVSVPLTRLLFTSFQPGGGLALARLGPAEAARLLMLETFNLESLEERCTELLARVVESCPAWVIRYDDAVHASALVATFVIDDSG